jgi:2-hydroxy-6-oxonona-2,4-dienedioate hydrolase
MALTEEGLINVPGVVSRWVRLANGAKAHYMTAGEVGPSVILLHGGFPGSSGIALWRFMLPALAEAGFRVYAPCRPGFGLSDLHEEYWPHQGTFSWSDFVDDFANAACIERFHLSGNSQGASVSAQYAVEHPEKVISLAFVASFSLMAQLGLDDDGKARDRFPSVWIPTPWDGTKETLGKNLLAVAYDKSSIPDDLVEMRFRIAQKQMKSMNTAFAFNGNIMKDPKYAQRLRLKGRLDKLDIPAIFLWGKDDVMAPVEAGYEQENILKNFQFFYPDRCGHSGQNDRPDLFNKVFVEFFKTGTVSADLANEAGVSQRG